MATTKLTTKQASLLSVLSHLTGRGTYATTAQIAQFDDRSVDATCKALWRLASGNDPLVIRREKGKAAMHPRAVRHQWRISASGKKAVV